MQQLSLYQTDTELQRGITILISFKKQGITKNLWGMMNFKLYPFQTSTKRNEKER